MSINILPLFDHKLVQCSWNVMAHMQKLDFVFRRNGWVHLNWWGRQFSRLLAAKACASAGNNCIIFRKYIAHRLKMSLQGRKKWLKKERCVKWFIMCTNSWKGARSGAVGWGTVLQTGRSQDRLPMMSLEFFIDIILPAALWPWGQLRL
jgi:hypothetical protein